MSLLEPVARFDHPPALFTQQVDGKAVPFRVATLRLSPLQSPRIGGADGRAASLESQYLRPPPRCRVPDSLGTSFASQMAPSPRKHAGKTQVSVVLAAHLRPSHWQRSRVALYLSGSEMIPMGSACE